MSALLRDFDADDLDPRRGCNVRAFAALPGGPTPAGRDPFAVPPIMTRHLQAVLDFACAGLPDAEAERTASDILTIPEYCAFWAIRYAHATAGEDGR